MREYRQLEAYQLARGLLAGVCAAAPAGAAGSRLRHAAVTATTRIADGWSRAGEDSLEGSLDVARAALAEVAQLIAAARQEGQLNENLAEALLARQARAAQAVESLAPPSRPARS
jgi:hypothetical protein